MAEDCMEGSKMRTFGPKSGVEWSFTSRACEAACSEGIAQANRQSTRQSRMQQTGRMLQSANTPLALFMSLPLRIGAHALATSQTHGRTHGDASLFKTSERIIISFADYFTSRGFGSE